MPDSPETRIARLDERIAGLQNRLEAISEAVAPTTRGVIETGLKLAETEKDLADLRRQFDAAVDKRTELLRDIETKILACAEGVGDLEHRWRKEIEAAAEERRKERQTRNRWIVGLVCGFLCAFGGVYLGSVLG